MRESLFLTIGYQELDVIENIFGILVSRWRIFQRSICLNPEHIDAIIIAAVNLHNFLENNDITGENIYYSLNYVDTEGNTEHVIQGAWRFNVDSVNNNCDVLIYIER